MKLFKEWTKVEDLFLFAQKKVRLLISCFRMNPLLSFTLILTAFIVSSWGSEAAAQISEAERLSGFAKHQKENSQYDKARQQGERAFLEEEEQWENKKMRALQEFKKQRKDRFVQDDGPEFQEDAAQKKKRLLQYEKDRELYAQDRKKKKSFDRQALGLPSEIQELGLDQDRPRYDYRKRASFGATPKYGKNSPSSSGSSGGSYGGGGSSSPSFPPPPSFDDFQDGGYLPAPTLNDDYMGDIPPPPPPPPFGGDMGFSGEGDFPPPPPPPPTFGDEPGDF